MAAAGVAAISILSPQGGEQWSVDSEHIVMWSVPAKNAPAAVQISGSFDGGKTWKELAVAAPNTGKWRWRIPETLSSQCRIRINDQTNNISGESQSDFVIIPSRQVANYKWVQINAEAEFAPRDGAGALVFKGKMWLLGGWSPKSRGDKEHFPRTCNNEVWSTRDGVSWRLEKTNSFLDSSFDPASDWEGRHTAGYVVYKDKMWIIGGDPIQGHYQDDVWNSADGKKWRWVNKGSKVPWGPRILHYTLVFNDKIWTMGGQTLPQFAPAAEMFYNDIWNTSDGVNWTKIEIKNPSWSKRGMIGGSAVFKDRMWILGGGTYDTPKAPERMFYNDVWSSRDGINWEQHVACAPWHPRQYHDVAVFDDRMWVLEGYHKDGGNRNDVWYSSDGVNWYELPNTPWKPRHAASVFVHDGALWMAAGNNMESDVWKLTGGIPHIKK